jgi:glycosyltransferase involved in cell wall biosynthesis
MVENKFSIIIPVFNKAEGIGRCLQSLISQTYGDFEVIIIDDGSTDGSKEIIKSFMNDRRIRAYFFKENAGRLVARNVGMRMSRNEYICWLDADDEYMPTYLERYNYAINTNPEYKIFNSGMLIKERKDEQGEIIEDGWRIISPLTLEETKKGMSTFGKGNIGTGSFVFKRELMWFFPENVKCAEGLDNPFGERLVETDGIFKEICKQNDEGHWLPLGNPWGDDYAYVWYLTRKNKMKTINSLLYIQYVRI